MHMTNIKTQWGRASRTLLLWSIGCARAVNCEAVCILWTASLLSTDFIKWLIVSWNSNHLALDVHLVILAQEGQAAKFENHVFHHGKFMTHSKQFGILWSKWSWLSWIEPGLVSSLQILPLVYQASRSIIIRNPCLHFHSENNGWISDSWWRLISVWFHRKKHVSAAAA